MSSNVPSVQPLNPSLSAWGMRIFFASVFINTGTLAEYLLQDGQPMTWQRFARLCVMGVVTAFIWYWLMQRTKNQKSKTNP